MSRDAVMMSRDVVMSRGVMTMSRDVVMLSRDVVMLAVEAVDWLGVRAPAVMMMMKTLGEVRLRRWVMTSYPGKTGTLYMPEKMDIVTV